MARITVEDCLVQQSNRFHLVMLASRRAKQLLQGKTPLTDTKGNKSIVSALREIAAGQVRFIEREEIEAELASQLTQSAVLAANDAAAVDEKAPAGEEASS